MVLSEWSKLSTTDMDVSGTSRILVEKALITTHRYVFGVFFWVLMLAGLACDVMYRIVEYLARGWNEPDHIKNEAFGRFAMQEFYWIDRIPARLRAVACAVVGNFEDMIYAWRNFSGRWKNETDGID